MNTDADKEYFKTSCLMSACTSHPGSCTAGKHCATKGWNLQSGGSDSLPHLEVCDRAEALHLVNQHQVAQRTRLEKHWLKALFSLHKVGRAGLDRIIAISNALPCHWSPYIDSKYTRNNICERGADSVTDKSSRLVFCNCPLLNLKQYAHGKRSR